MKTSCCAVGLTLGMAAWGAMAGLCAAAAPASTNLALSDVQRFVRDGRWQEAQRAIDHLLSQPGAEFAARQALLWERERMRRIGLDFSKTRDQVLTEAGRIVPGLDPSLFAKWEREGAVESLRIDGETRYFNRAAGNVFRVHPEARALKRARQPAADETPAHRKANLQAILQNATTNGQPGGTPKLFRVTHILTVKAGAVPPGEVLRVWLPFPQTLPPDQHVVRVVGSDPPQHLVSPRGSALSSIYLEKPALAWMPTRFGVTYEYVNRGFHRRLDPARVRAVSVSDPSLAPFLAERPPHLVFDEDLRRLSREIVGGETNLCRVAQRLFEWVHGNIPWAGAREYSTLECLPRYALERRHGDCGIQTMLFMALCRMNGIPARWESGWVTGPDKNMHDWCRIYLEPYGWVPADVSYGLTASSNEAERWFYLGGLDSCRLVVNTDHGQPLFPAKTHFRSEPVDFQRGEVEWRGGNLYFDQWECSLEVSEIAAGTAAAPSGDTGLKRSD